MEYFPEALSREKSDALADAIRAHIEEHGCGLWAVEIPGVASFAGYVGLAMPRFEAHFTPCTEIGWRLASSFWGHGYATEGALAVMAFGFQTLGLNEIVSLAASDNHQSRRVMERLGMVRNPEDDFDHPAIRVGHKLRRHVLYRKNAQHGLAADRRLTRGGQREAGGR